MEYLIAGAVCAAGLVIPAVLGMTSPHRRRRSAPPGRWPGRASRPAGPVRPRPRGPVDESL